MHCSGRRHCGWREKESTVSEREERACWCHQWSEVASVCVFSMLSVWSERPLEAEILMHPDGNFTKSSYCGALHFPLLLLEPGSLLMLAVKIGAANATVGSLTPPGLLYVLCSLNNWWNMYLSPSGVVRSLLRLRQLDCKTNPCPTCLSICC